MKPKWPNVPLGEVLCPVERGETPQAGKLYQQLGVRLWGEGAYARESIDGSQTRYPQFTRVEADDIVVNKIWARNGSVAVVREELAGYYVSTEFPTFAPNHDRLDPRWMHWLTKTPGFWQQCDERARGTSGKNRIRPEQFLRVEIPLPPVTEQRRIVARIEQLAAQIEEARRLRHQATEETETLMPSAVAGFFSDAGPKWKPVPLGDHVAIQGGFAFKSDEYVETGLPIVRISNLEGEIVHVNDSPCMPESRFDEFSRFALHGGDILIAMTGATTGKLGIVPEDCDRWLLNQRVGRFLPKDRTALEPKYIYWLARGVQKKVFETAYGGAQPNISPHDIERMEFPFPPPDEQRRIVEYLDGLAGQVAALARLQSETAAELDALLPSVLDKAFKGEL